VCENERWKYKERKGEREKVKEAKKEERESRG